MFELSFGEILLFTTVALIVLGPERLPALARFLGRTFDKVQHFVSNVKAEIGAEIALDDFRQMKQELEESAQSLRQDLHDQAEQLRQVKQEVGDIPYWDKLPPLRTPADFGLTDDADMHAERHWVATEQARGEEPSTHIAQKSRQRRKHIRPYQQISRHSAHIGARRQSKLSRHG